MLTENDVLRISRRIVEGYAPLAVGIFGSYAVGAATARSDLDVFVISNNGGDLAARVLAVKRLLFGYLHPIDIFVFTPQEFEESARKEESFTWVIARQARLLHWTNEASRIVPSLAPKGVQWLAATPHVSDNNPKKEVNAMSAPGPVSSPVLGATILQIARAHVGQEYALGILVPKNNPNWSGPWDCSEFASWIVFQAAGTLYGCDSDHGDPAMADAFTGFWQRDANSLGQIVSIDQAARTPGAAVLRIPQPGSTGHIVISDGAGGTVEAHSSKDGIIQFTLANRRWDMGILVPGITYTGGSVVQVPPPNTTIYRLMTPMMTGDSVREIQQALEAAGFDPGPLDGEFGSLTYAAVVAFQLSRGLLPDGEVGPKTAAALGVQL